MRFTIIKYPDPLLTKHCDPIRKVTKELAEFGKDLIETVMAENGLGLSAPQVGITIRVIVVKIAKKYVVMFNPVVLAKSNTKRAGNERCLSFNEGEEYEVKRPTWVKIKFLDIYNKPRMMKLEGLESICFWHEMDHLSGITMNISGVRINK